jgi:hypothetical protein
MTAVFFIRRPNVSLGEVDLKSCKAKTRGKTGRGEEEMGSRDCRRAPSHAGQLSWGIHQFVYLLRHSGLARVFIFVPKIWKGKGLSSE